MASAQQIEYNYKTLLRKELNFNDNFLLHRLSLVNTPLREKCQQYKANPNNPVFHVEVLNSCLDCILNRKQLSYGLLLVALVESDKISLAQKIEQQLKIYINTYNRKILDGHLYLLATHIPSTVLQLFALEYLDLPKDVVGTNASSYDAIFCGLKLWQNKQEVEQAKRVLKNYLMDAVRSNLIDSQTLVSFEAVEGESVTDAHLSTIASHVTNIQWKQFCDIYLDSSYYEIAIQQQYPEQIDPSMSNVVNVLKKWKSQDKSYKISDLARLVQRAIDNKVIGPQACEMMDNTVLAALMSPLTNKQIAMVSLHIPFHQMLSVAHNQLQLPSDVYISNMSSSIAYLYSFLYIALSMYVAEHPTKYITEKLRTILVEFCPHVNFDPILNDKLNLTPEMLAKMASRIPHSHIKEVIQRLELTLPKVAKNVTLPVATILNIWKNKLDKPRTVLNLWEVLCDASPAVGNEPIRVLHATTVSDDYQTNASVVRQLLDLIVDRDCSPHKFLRGLRVLNEAIPIQQFVDDTGMNVLHMLVTHERMSLLKTLLWGGFFHYLENVPYNNKTAFQMAQRFESAEVANEILYLSALCKQLNPLDWLALSGGNCSLDHFLGYTITQLCSMTSKNPTILYAVISGNTAYFQYLIVVNAKLGKEHNILVPLAACFGHLLLLKILLDKFSLNPETVDAHGMTALKFAYQNGDMPMIKYLTFEKKCTINSGDALLLAIGTTLSFVEDLHAISFITNESYCYKRQRDGITPLMYAVSKGRLEMVVYLLSCRADIQVRDNRGENVFHKMSYIEERGDEEQYKALITSIFNNLVNVCKSIEKREIQSMSDASSFRPPLDICMLERIDYIDEMSTDINHIRITEESANSKVLDGDMKGSTLSHNSYPWNSTIQDATPLMFALLNKKIHLATLLLSVTPNVSLGNARGWAPVHLAAKMGNLNILIALDKKGANVEAMTVDGQTPASIAKIHKQLCIVDYLRDSETIEKAQKLCSSVLQPYSEKIDPASLSSVIAHGVDLRRVLISNGRELYTALGELIYDLDMSEVSDAEVPTVVTSKRKYEESRTEIWSESDPSDPANGGISAEEMGATSTQQAGIS